MDVMTAYEQWLKDFAADTDTIADLKAIADDPKEIEDRFYTELSFGTAGMRGVLGAGMNRMNRYNVRRATKGLAQYLLKTPEQAARGVVIAYDSRRFSAEFAKDTALVLAQEGVPAFLFDALRPVPVLSYAVRHLNAIAGVVITASHNPGEWNGFKLCKADAVPISGATGIMDIQKIVENRSWQEVTVKGSISTYDITGEYAAFLRSHAKMDRKLKVVVDYANAITNISIFSYVVFLPFGSFSI